MRHLNPQEVDEARKLAVDLASIHHRLMRVGLYRTGHALHTGALQMIGYEIEERMPKSEAAVHESI